MPVIECTSFINPRLMPQFADSSLIGSSITKSKDTKYLVFAPNSLAAKMAADENFDGISFSVTPCEETIKKSSRIGLRQLMNATKEIVDEAKSNKLFTRCYVSFCMGSEHCSDIDPKRVNEVANQLNEMGVNEIVLQDNISAGTIEKLGKLLDTITVPKDKLAIHFHDSKSNGMELLLYALSKGIPSIDSAVSGLGQCPHNKSPLGNLVTEEMIFIFDVMGIEHGVLWKPLLAAGDFISEAMARENCTDVFDVDFNEELDKYKTKYADLIKSLK